MGHKARAPSDSSSTDQSTPADFCLTLDAVQWTCRWSSVAPRAAQPMKKNLAEICKIHCEMSSGDNELFRVHAGLISHSVQYL